MRDPVEPRGQNGVRCQAVRVAGETKEGGLGDLLGELGRADLAQRGGINEVEMTTDDFGERVFRLFPGVTREQFQIVVAHVYLYITAG